MWLVLGLGNPGGQYARTRHNVGFVVADRLAERDGASCERKQLGALVERVRIAGEDAVLAKPMQFMNESGQAGASLRGYYKLHNADIVVIHDDLELPFGEVALKQGGGHGGHNGLRDLQRRLGGNDFYRVRVGIGRPPKGWDVADYVLASFTTEEQAELDRVVDEAADGVARILSEGGVPGERGRGRGRRPSGAGSSRRRASSSIPAELASAPHLFRRAELSQRRHITL
jgi:PTH1 family peptidyl-tRNA hydrolase